MLLSEYYHIHNNPLLTLQVLEQEVMVNCDVNARADCWFITIGTIHNPLPSHHYHPWRAGGAVEDMTMPLAQKTSMPSCPGKNTVMYLLFANVDTLISAGWLIPGITIVSLAP